MRTHPNFIVACVLALFLCLSSISAAQDLLVTIEPGGSLFSSETLQRQVLDVEEDSRTRRQGPARGILFAIEPGVAAFKSSWKIARDTGTGQTELEIHCVDDAGKRVSLDRCDWAAFEPDGLFSVQGKGQLYAIETLDPAATCSDGVINPKCRTVRFRPSTAEDLSADSTITIKTSQVTWIAAASLSDSETALTPLLVVGGSGARFQATAAHANVGLDDGSLDLDVVATGVKAKLRGRTNLNKNNQTAVVVSFQEVEDVSDTSKVVLSGNLGFGKTKPCRYGCSINFAANLGWGEKKLASGGSSTDDLLGGVGLSFKVRPAVRVAGDYMLDNKLDGEDRFSLALTQTISAGTSNAQVKLAIAKHGTISASYTVVF